MQTKDVDDLVILWAAMRQRGEDEPNTFKRLRREHPEIPEKVALAKMSKLVKRGLLDYGVSLETAWLTDAGREALAGEFRQLERTAGD